MLERAMDWKAILNQAAPFVKQALGNVAESVMPDCDLCGEMGLPIRCVGCQGFSCLEHAYVNYSTQQFICTTCAESMGAKKRPKKRKVRKVTKQSHEVKRSGYPWVVLGIPPNSSEEVINKAFRQKAAKCHPDKGGSKEEFNKLNEAKEVAIKIVRGGI